MEKALKRLKAIDKEIGLLLHTVSLLSWDQETYMPAQAITERAEQLSLLQGYIHEKIIHKENEELLEKLDGVKSLHLVDRAFIREYSRRYHRSIKIPKQLVVEIARQTSIGQAKWVEAKKKADFSLFRPNLKIIVDLKKQIAKCYGFKDNPYDPLLDEYEPWITTKEVQAIFDRFEGRLINLLKKIVQSGRTIDNAFLKNDFDLEKQKNFSMSVLKKMNFDFNRGRLDVSAHPFTTTLGESDIRLTTRYNKNYFPAALFGTIHEAGHGLYEQGLSKNISNTLLSNGTSLGIHESQSRFWENMIGRSIHFWQAFYPEFKAAFRQALTGIALDRFYRAINKVEPSLIRVEADEVTYNLHIVLRFHLEIKLMADEIPVEDLPAAWRTESKKLLGIVPGNDAEGLLQDVHWSMGAIGYFPTYTLGNLYACQFYNTLIKQNPDIIKQIEKGKLTPILEWLKTNIHQHGSIHPAQELCQRVTGEKLNPDYFMDYLENKYGEIYGI